jgi:glutamyl-tRNA reductase
LDRAVKLAETLGGKAVPFDNALETSESADILITSTGSSQYIIQPWEARLLMVRRNQRPLVIIDIAVPRDVDPECGKIQGLQLYNIDDLEAVVADNIRFRQGEAEQARRIVQEELDALEERFQYLSCRPVMVSLSDKAEHIRKREIRRALSKLPDISDEEKRIMDHMTRMIVRKMLREPMMHLNESAGTDQESVYKSAVTSLFRLNVRKENLLAKSN